MRILFVSEYLPYPIDNGVKLRYYNVMKNLKDNGHYIILIYVIINNKEIQINNKLYESYCNELIEFSPYKLNRQERFRDIFYKLSHFDLLRNKRRNDYVENFFSNIFKKNRFDLIHCVGLKIGLLMMSCNLYPRILDLIDSMSLFQRRRLLTSKSVIDMIESFFIYLYTKKIEKLVVKKWKFISVVSNRDKEQLDAFKLKSKIYTIRNGIDYNYYYPKKMMQNNTNVIVFHGSMNYSPNQKAAIFIANKIFPLIKNEIPSVKLYIVGKDPTTQIKNLENIKDVIVTGYVIDIRDYILIADVILEPMLSGSGIKNKILEALSMEKAVVTNLLGCEGFNDELRKYLLIGRTPEEMAKKVIKLLKDEELRKKLGKLGREVIINKYDWQVVSKKYESIYTKLIKINMMRNDTPI